MYHFVNPVSQLRNKDQAYFRAVLVLSQQSLKSEIHLEAGAF